MIFSLIADEQAQVRARAAKQELDEAIIARIGTGDRDALATLYYQTQDAVFGFALSILRNRHTAEDVLQDTYIRIWHSAKSYRPQGKPMAWIITIARNLSLSKLREHQSRELPLEEQLDTISVPDPAPGQVDHLVLMAALETLGQEERQIVMLHSLSGLKHREIAEILQLPLSTVLSKYRRALAKLKLVLKEDD